MCARHARRRRILLRFKAPSRSAPHDQDVPNISALQNTGTRIPITKCFEVGFPHSSLRGARLRANPESIS
ncbi:MAG TPA: hypothetical protein DDW72_05510 [Afipia sp.]|nr:hypothetical protein [Afipia sp.]